MITVLLGRCAYNEKDSSTELTCMVEVDRHQGTGNGSAGWDPYQVWAERVRQEFPKRVPREKRGGEEVQPARSQGVPWARVPTEAV